MNSRGKTAGILAVIPLALLLLGAIITFVYGLWANARGMWTEGVEWLIFIFCFLPIAALIAVPLAIIALRMNRRGYDLLVVKIFAAIDLAFAVPVLLMRLILLFSSGFTLWH